MPQGFVTSVKRNSNLANCESEVFFQKVRTKLAAYCAAHPNAKVLTLAVGDVTEPIPAVITSAMEQYSRGLSTPEGFSVYVSHQGIEPLRNRIAEILYKGLGVKAPEVFVSDGAKGCFVRLQMLFGPEVTVAVQDPSYPVISQMCNLVGPGGSFAQKDSRLVYMKGDPERNFFPDLASLPRTDLIYFCSPNNPTGMAATRQQLENLVAFAKKNGSIIIYDAVYSAFMTDDCPKSIYEIPGAREVAIEVGSFSKFAGFTGVRLGWAIVPESLLFANGQPIITDFHQVLLLTYSAGPSNVVQAGGLGCLTQEGLKEIKKRIEFYKENARILMEAFASLGLKVYGGQNSPYLWVEFPGRSSDDAFNELLEKVHILTTPGSLFGPSGDGFLRVSSFGHREFILEAVERLKLLQS